MSYDFRNTDFHPDYQPDEPPVTQEAVQEAYRRGVRMLWAIPILVTAGLAIVAALDI